jgi:hypothetical protein
MKETLVRALFFWLTLMILVQPMLSHIDFLLDMIVKANTEYAAEKAAPEGILSGALRQDVLQNLAAVGFDPSEVVLESSATVVERTERLDVRIQAPRRPMLLFRFGSEALPEHYYGHAYVMSEYIP